MALTAYKEIYQRYFSKLIKCLPMDDRLFLVMLSEHELLPAIQRIKLTESQNTQAEKAEYFVSHVIKPSLEADSRAYLDKLLLVMSESGYKYLEEISCKINSEISEEISNPPKRQKTGMHVITRIINIQSDATIRNYLH